MTTRPLGTHAVPTGGAPHPVTLYADGRQRINLGSNNYLGLAGDPRVIEATMLTSSGINADVTPVPPPAGPPSSGSGTTTWCRWPSASNGTRTAPSPDAVA